MERHPLASSPQDSIKRYEVNIAKAVGLDAGKRALDLGCGVGGPMRTIAAATGAHVTGITINEYQVKRARAHNTRAGLGAQCSVVQGNFLELPFPEASFDAAYCIEAACHAPQLEVLYAQAFKVLKPGGKFGSYEWLKTPKYDAAVPEHVRVVDGVAEGNALPDVRDLAAVLAAAKSVGFEVVSTSDAALTAHIPWQAAMTSARLGSYVTHVITAVLEFIGWAPKARARWDCFHFTKKRREKLESRGRGAPDAGFQPRRAPPRCTRCSSTRRWIWRRRADLGVRRRLRFCLFGRSVRLTAADSLQFSRPCTSACSRSPQNERGLYVCV